MRTVLWTLGAVLLGVVLLGVGLIVTVSLTLGPKLASATAFAEEAVPAIANGWKSDELWSRASQEFKATTNERVLKDTFGQLMRLGAYEAHALRGCVVQSSVGRPPNTYVGRCAADVTFSRGAAVFHLSLTEEENAWRIRGLYVEPSLKPFELDGHVLTSFGLGAAAPVGDLGPRPWSPAWFLKAAGFSLSDRRGD